MANQTGIAITIRAFLPTGKTLDEQFNALSIVKTAHETSDYAPLLAAASVEEVKTEQRTRRIEDTPPVVRPADDTAETDKTTLATTEPAAASMPQITDEERDAAEAQAETSPIETTGEPIADAQVPKFLKRGSKAA
ncbi:MAG TPA: hypothetical protein VIU82_21815 [Bosea sp. (in: a-proteobacteria)]